MSERNIEIARHTAEAISRREVETLRELMAPECEIVPIRAAIENTVFRGPDALAKWFAAQDDAWASVRSEVEAFHDGPDWVLALGRIRARGRSSGAVLDVSAAAIYRFRAGRVTSIRIYTDRSEALADLGLAPGEQWPGPRSGAP